MEGKIDACIECDEKPKLNAVGVNLCLRSRKISLPYIEPKAKKPSIFEKIYIGGISQFYRETKTGRQRFISAKDAALGFDGGAGFEYLFNQNKNFIGLQVLYHYVRFPNENDEIVLPDENGQTINSGLKAAGDLWQIGITGGFNF